MKPHKHAALIHAWAEGAEIQYREDSASMWTDIINPLWDVMFEYRIKPRTVKREGWVHIVKYVAEARSPGAIIFHSREIAELNKPHHWVATVKVEWEEEE